MFFGLIVDGVLVQKQGNPQEGFIEIPDDAVCGMLFDGKKWSNPEPEPPFVPFQNEAIIQSPNGTPFKVTVDDAGTLETVPLT